jgi:hypothetical protein
LEVSFTGASTGPAERYLVNKSQWYKCHGPDRGHRHGLTGTLITKLVDLILDDSTTSRRELIEEAGGGEGGGSILLRKARSGGGDLARLVITEVERNDDLTGALKKRQQYYREAQDLDIRLPREGLISREEREVWPPRIAMSV